MYLVIFEDGGCNYIGVEDDELLRAADDGLLDIFNIAAFPPLRYFEGEWQEVGPIDE